VVFALDCHDREVPAWLASPRPLTGADVRTPMDRTLWARFGETTVTAPTLSSGCPMTAPSARRRPPCCTPMRSASPRSRPRPIARGEQRAVRAQLAGWTVTRVVTTFLAEQSSMALKHEHCGTRLR